MKMAANAEIPTRVQIVAHLIEHHWTKAHAKALVMCHAAMIGVVSCDDWEDLSVEFAEAQA